MTSHTISNAYIMFEMSVNEYEMMSSDLDPQAKFFKYYRWLEKNSADIRLS